MLDGWLTAVLPARDWLPRWDKILLALIALGLGLLLARLPLLWAGIALLTAVLVVLTFIEPLVGLGAALILGLSKPLTDYFVPELPLDLGQIALLVTLGAWFLHIVRTRKSTLPASPLNIPLYVFIGAASLSLLNALSLGYALKELVKWVQLLAVMWLVIDLAGERRWRVVVGFVLAAAAVQAAIGVWQFALRGDGPEHFAILDGRFYRAYGTFEQPNPYGGFIGMILPLSIGLWLGALEYWIKPIWTTWRTGQRTVFINRNLCMLAGLSILSGLLLMALVMSWSRGAWLGFGAAGLMMLLACPRRAWMGLALVTVTVTGGMLALEMGVLPDAIGERLTGFSEFVETFDVRGVDITSDNYAVIERLAHWQAAEEMARYHPWIGVGFGNYEPVYPAYALMNWPYPLGHAHNIYLNLLAETGIIGLAAYGALWGVVLWHTWRATRSQPLWQRSAAVGLIGVWTHLSVHQFLDKLYVANIHLHIGALLGILSIFIHHGGFISFDREQ